jgi:TIR domain
MGGIFISYRRNDSGPEAARLRDALIRDFGANQVFRDRDSITPGERFPLRVERELSSCDALLVVIGSTWLSIQDDAGQRRLDDPNDSVHLEIATVLARADDVLVIPVLVGTASMPARVDLPKPLAALADCQAQPLSEESWDDQVARLTRAVEEVVKPGVAAPLPLHFAAPQPEVTAGAVPRPQRREHAAGTLAESVHRQWEEEAKIRGLFDPDPMPVHWTLTEHDVSDHSRHIFRRRLVILGGPGSGKTTLAVQLLLRLLEVRTPAEPIPVLLTANSGTPQPIRGCKTGSPSDWIRIIPRCGRSTEPCPRSLSTAAWCCR